MDRFCVMLAIFNAIEAGLCFLDFGYNPSAKTFVAALAWVGSTAFWLYRGRVPR